MARTMTAPKLIKVPAGTRATHCRGSTCGGKFYWVRNERTGAAMPIDCSGPDCQTPSVNAVNEAQESLFGDRPEPARDGFGVLHHTRCPDVAEFSRGRR